MIKLDNIPKEMLHKRHERCAKCSTRKWYAKRLDYHFDWVDCPYVCPNDYEHLERELAKMDEVENED